jgi:hypothetical protein
MSVNDFASAAVSLGNRNIDRNIREVERPAEKLRWGWLTAGQVWREEHWPHRQRGCFESRYGLVQNILVRLFVGNLGLGLIRNLIAATGARGDFAIGQQQFT